jgi:hypothetical protein
LQECGYHSDLVFTGQYVFGEGKDVDLAAFAHSPRDARSACIGGVDVRNGNTKAEVMSRRTFGAPVVFTCVQDFVQVWRPGPSAVEQVGPNLTREQLPAFFREHHKRLSPSKVYEAKTIGRLRPGPPANRFVDPSLLPFAEQHVGGDLVEEVEAMIDVLKQSYGNVVLTDRRQEWVMKHAFRLLAAKVLHDKGVPGFDLEIEPDNLGTILVKVNRHYGSDDAVSLGRGAQREALREAASRAGGIWDLRHLTTEALADVYETALLDKDTRKRGGTHRTPAYVSDYVLWRLAPWIEQLDPSQMRIFEAACGHAPFLVSAARLLRTLDLSIPPGELSPFFRQRLAGIDFDHLATEIAKLSLTVADVPNKNGWRHVRWVPDMFRRGVLDKEVKRCSVFLSNPPFEGTRPIRLLRTLLDNLQPGTVFGLVLPTSQLISRKRPVRDLRRRLLDTCQLEEVTLLPDGVFEHADQECTLLLGRRLRTQRAPLAHVRCRRVREEDLPAFRDCYEFTTDRVYAQARFRKRPDRLPWIEELHEEVWSHLEHLRPLEDFADVGKGLEHKGKGLPPGAITVSDQPFPGAVKGFANVEETLELHGLPEEVWFNLAPDVIRRKGLGTVTGVPQVLVNYGPVSRSPWRLKAVIDREGHAASSRFLIVRPKSDLPLEYLWALLNSPLANAYLYTHALKREVPVSTLRELKVPKLNPIGTGKVVAAVKAYFDLCAALQEGTLFDSNPRPEVSVGEVHHQLRLVDAEVLRLYRLPARSEFQLLSHLRERRRGVPGEFRGYYPSRLRAVMLLRVYLSRTYQHFQRDGNVELDPEQEREFDRLIEKHISTGLDPDEREKLRELQVEVAGRDFAVRTPDRSRLDVMRARQRRTREELASLANRLTEVMQKRGRE